MSSASKNDDLPQPFGPTSTMSRAVSGTLIVRSMNRLNLVTVAFSMGHEDRAWCGKALCSWYAETW